MENSPKYNDIHAEALELFQKIFDASHDEREASLEDRRFATIRGAQWESETLDNNWGNKPRYELNKVALSLQKVVSEYRNNRITVDFIPSDGLDDEISDICDQLYRADEQDSAGFEAYDNAFGEAILGGFGAWRLFSVEVDPEDPENDMQRIQMEPIYDADSCVYFDANAKRKDKKDASYCFVMYRMDHNTYEKTYDDSPESWPDMVNAYEFEWVTTDHIAICEYYVKETVNRKAFVFKDIMDETHIFYEDEVDEKEMSDLYDRGYTLVKEKKVQQTKVKKYILSGGGVLKDCGYIVGKNIPIVPVYGQRWVIDGVERFKGKVRDTKDPQRLKNKQISKLVEISVESATERPIFTPEQVAGHEQLWKTDTEESYPFLLVNKTTDSMGAEQPIGPLGYTKPPVLPPALVGLLQQTESDLEDILGRQSQGEKMMSNVSGKTVEAIQNRIDAYDYVYIDNMASAIRRCGEIWLSMAKDLYVEDKRTMKGVGRQDEIQKITLNQPVIRDGVQVLENNLEKAKLDVTVSVGPTSRSQREAILRSVIELRQFTNDPETGNALENFAIQNLDGEGIQELREFARKKNLRLGIGEPNEKDKQDLEIERQIQAQNDAQTQYLQAESEKAKAQAIKAQADAGHTVAKTEKTKAETIETLASVDNERKKFALDALSVIRNGQ